MPAAPNARFKMKTTSPQTLPIAALITSPTNPRKVFAEEPLKQLAETIREHGILQQLLVRPIDGGKYEIVDGERRYRAAQIAGLDSVPVRVRDLSDADVIVLQLVCGADGQAVSLSPLEEAEGYQRALELRDEKGRELFTMAKLATKLGSSKAHISSRVALLKLPEPLQLKIREGVLQAGVAYALTRLPDETDRAAAADEILSTPEPMSQRAALELLREKYMAPLAAAPYRLDDETLPGPDGTPQACTKCSHNSAVQEGGRRPACMMPACYRGKCNAVWARRCETAQAAGMRVLSDAEAKAVFDKNSAEPELAPDSPYVAIDSKPDYRHVPDAVEDKSLPTWRQMIDEAKEKNGIEVPVVLARDSNGRAWELVETKLAIEAARGIEDIFRKDAVGFVARSTDEFKAAAARERAEAKARIEKAQLALAAVFAAARPHEQTLSTPEDWGLLTQLVIEHMSGEALDLLVRHLKLSHDAGPFGRSDALKAWALEHQEERLGLLWAMLTAQGLRQSGFAAPQYRDVARLLAFDPDEPEAAQKQVSEEPKTQDKTAELRDAIDRLAGEENLSVRLLDRATKFLFQKKYADLKNEAELTVLLESLRKQRQRTADKAKQTADATND